MKSRKMFTFEHMDGSSKLRVLVPETAAKYDPTLHFMWFEESDYLADALNGVPYATFKTDLREEMENLLQNGFTDKNGVIWTSFFGYWKDQEGHAFMCPETAGIKDLRDVGVITDMKSPADFMKVGKYANRLFAALPKNLSDTEGIGQEGVWGKEVSWNEADQTAIIRVDVPSTDLTEEDRELAVRYVDLNTLTDDQKAAVDGALIVSEKACRVLGLSKEPRLGMAWRGTFGTERGLGKGHILYKNDMLVDVVIYGPKTILKTTKFFFGSMGELHVGTPHTDRQAFVNFHMHRQGLGVELAKTYMRQVNEASKNETELRRLFLKHTKDVKHSDMDQEGWVLRRALAYGVSFLKFPGLFRRVVRYLMKKVMQCDQRVRIPMDTIANYGYVLPDPNIITSEGDVNLELSGIPEGHIVFPDVEPGTKVVCYRQPSENTNAWKALTVTYRPEYKRFASRGICLLGRGAKDVLGRLGGGDMDDQFIIIHDQKWVEAFHTMRPYPETEKLSADVTEEEQAAYDSEQSELNDFTEELLFDLKDRNLAHYTNKHISWQIDMAKNARAGIGPVVNFGIFDMLMSDPDHKASMLNDLQSNVDAHGWLEEREDFQAALFMTNLEVVIDGNVKDTTLLRKLGDVSGTIKEFHKNAEVYPLSMVSRIPASKQERADYVVARSLTCKALETIITLRNRLAEVFIEREWAMVAPADKELRLDYPATREIIHRVAGQWRRVDNQWERVDETQSLKDIWANGWTAEMAREGGPREGFYDHICKLIAAEVEGEDDDMMEAIAVELYYQSYKTYQSGPKLDETTGATRTYSDGLLWSPVFGNHFINALRKARLAGFYKVAEIRPEYIKRLKDKSVVVEIRNHSLYIQDADDTFSLWVGFVQGKSPNGKYRMDSGLIEFRKPQPICLPEDAAIIAQKPLTRVVPSSVKAAAEATQDVQPKGALGKLIQKALNILK